MPAARPARPDRTFCVAPMMARTDRHYRYLARLLSGRAMLYTEMTPAAALLHGDAARLLRCRPAERPLALQVGGNRPDELRRCAELAEAYGYDEVNLNVGCPSERAQDGTFGACLMQQPGRVAECAHAMREAVDIPVTVKHRIGIDDCDEYARLLDFVATVAQSGCRVFIAHARNAWLRGLSPKQNRDIPPLRYEYVYRLKRDMPHLQIIINGGIATLDECARHLNLVDGVMLGRAAYHNLWLLAEVDRRFYCGRGPAQSRKQALQNLLPYIIAESRRGTALRRITRHIAGLFHGLPEAKQWRREAAMGWATAREFARWVERLQV